MLPTFEILAAAYGLTLIITESYIFKPLRQLLFRQFPDTLGKLVYCCICTGFWAGVICSLGYHVYMGTNTHPIRHFMDGVTASGVCWLLHVIVAALGVEELDPYEEQSEWVEDKGRSAVNRTD